MTVMYALTVRALQQQLREQRRITQQHSGTMTRCRLSSGGADTDADNDTSVKNSVEWPSLTVLRDTVQQLAVCITTSQPTSK